MRDHSPIDTERLRLTPLTAAHADAMFAIMREPDAMRFWSEPPHASLRDSERMIADLTAGPARAWAVALRDSGDVVGLVYYLGNAGPPGMGYILRPDHWGRGLMTEAVRAALGYGFQRIGLDRVELWIDSRNLPSQRVATRAGFTRRGAFRQKYPRDESAHEKLVFGLRADEWRADGRAPPPAAGRAYGIIPVLAAPDVAATAAFYRDKLGFDISFLHGDPPTYGAVTLSDWTAGGATIHLAHDASGGGSMRLYVNVGDDIADLAAAFRARGVEAASPLARTPWGQREFSIRDCNGCLLTFGAPG